ncbi:MAG: DUF4440 domain-containing protein [Bacteroidales bacterium]|nr:DUF4440 domain-containing protein [Bacteroidales bacterium]
MRTIHLIRTLLLSSILVISSCFPEPDTKHEATLAIRNNWDSFINHWETQDAAGCASFFSEDGYNVPDEFRTLKGRSEIESFYNTLFSGSQSSKYVHNILSVSVTGDDAIELGEFTVDWLSNEGEAWTYKARSIAHWQKDENENWKIKGFLFNKPAADNGSIQDLTE